MKQSLFKLFTGILLICLSGNSFAQDFQGKAYYQTKTTVDMSQFGGGRQIQPDQMKRIQERMKSILEKQYTLVFNKEESIYKEEEQRLVDRQAPRCTAVAACLHHRHETGQMGKQLCC